MTRALYISILDRRTLETAFAGICYQWEIKIDPLDNSQSSFEFPETVDYKAGDLLLVRFVDGEFYQKGRSGGIKPFYVGVLTNSENKDKDSQKTILNAYSLPQLLDLEFPATTISGRNVQEHLYRLIQRYFLGRSFFQAPPLEIDYSGAGISHQYQPSQPPTATSLLDYSENIFKKYGVTWSVEELKRRSDGSLVLATKIAKPDGILRFKNNVADFQNWNVYVSPANKEAVNHVSIISKNTSNSENPQELAQYFLGDDGSIRPDSSRARLPVKSKVAIYDTSATDKPSYESVARQELEGSLYSHEIEFSMPYYSELCSLQDVEIGKDSLIVYDGKNYPSILTGMYLSSESERIVLKFGNSRSTLKQLLKQ